MKRVMVGAYMAFYHGMEYAIRTCTRRGRVPVWERSASPWLDRLESRSAAIQRELAEVMRAPDEIPLLHDLMSDQRRLTMAAQWKSFFLLIAGEPVARNAERCPATMAALREIPGIQTAMFSILAPRAHIPEHRGIYNGFLRFHLALITPVAADSCWIRVADQRINWRSGSCFVFDDTFPHEVHNDTDEIRVVLLCDVVRPLPFPLSLLNRVVIAGLRRSRLVREPLEKLNRQN